jgi:DNA primase large subunit
LQFGTDDLAKYTFLPQAGDYIRQNGISLTDLSKPEYRSVLTRAQERVLESIKTGKISGKVEGSTEVEIMSFPVSLMLVRATKLDHLMTRYALSEAIRVESFLNSEKNDKIIEDIFSEFIKIKLEHSTAPGFPKFKIPMSEYLKRSVEFHKPEWKLVNRIVQNGRVFVSQKDLTRLIREEIRLLILQRLRATNIPKLPDELNTMVEDIVKLTPPPRSAYSIVSISPENYPPCLRHALALLEKGENVPHYGRFLMATYLLAAGKTVDDIMALFPKSPDFKASVTKYQVEHIAGIKGGRTRYSVPSCQTLQTHSFCFKDPIKCYDIKSPLQYPSRKVKPEQTTDRGTKRKSDTRREQKRGWTKPRR